MTPPNGGLRRRRTPCFSILLLLSTAPSFVLACEARTAQPLPPWPELDALVAPFVENRDFEGVVLVKTQDGSLRFRSYGIGGEPGPSIDAPFPVGSITKTFTAAAIQQLEAAGDLALTDPVSRFIPELPEGDEITVEDLLLHRSGVPDYYVAPGFNEIRAEPMPLADFAGWISEFPLDYPPGSSNSYTNSGYNLLALMVERATGVSYATYLRDEVFLPLGLSSARAGSRASAVPRGRTPRAAPALLGPPAPLDVTWLLGSGSASISALDLVRWVEEIARRVADGWPPYGWGVRGEGEARYLTQNGRIPGYAAVLEHHPRDGLTVVVLSTVESAAVDRIAAGATALVRGGAVAREAPRQEVTLDPVAAASYAGVYDFGGGFRLTVAPMGPGLGAGVGEGPDLQLGYLQPLGNDVFFFREAYIEVAFERNDEGDVIGLTWDGAGPFPPVAAPTADSTDIAAASRSFSAAYVRGDTATIRELYTVDAVLIPPGSELRGRDAVVRYFAPGARRRNVSHAMESSDLRIHGDVAIDIGIWRNTWRVDDGPEQSASGRYLIVWRRGEEGSWRIEYDMWHRPSG